MQYAAETRPDASEKTATSGHPTLIFRIVIPGPPWHRAFLFSWWNEEDSTVEKTTASDSGCVRATTSGAGGDRLLLAVDRDSFDPDVVRTLSRSPGQRSVFGRVRLSHLGGRVV